MVAGGKLSELTNLKHEIQNTGLLKQKPSKFGSLGRYFRYILYSWKLMFLEKELIVFTLLQWASVALGYYLFVMMLFWIPDEVWRSTQQSDEGSIADMVLFVWIIVCVGVAAFPLGIFSSCMAVVHILHYHQEKPSSVAACLRVVLPRAWSLWLFHWIDGYITVRQIIERLPKKNNRTPWAKRMASEALFYAWKIATMGIFPSLLTGRNIPQTCKDTMGLVKTRAFKLLEIRIGYSLLCWIVGVATYIWGIFNFGWIQERFVPGEIEDNVAELYSIAGIPALLAVAVIQLFLRPAYIIALTDVYAEYIHEKGEIVVQDNLPGPATSAIVAFGAFCIMIFAVYIYREPLGIMDMLGTPYGQEYVRKP